jgi:S-methylmethionine-dependent homocysteine/selenocysteine methylase
MHELLEEWRESNRVLLLDGGSGAELRQRGVAVSAPLWSAEGVHRAPGVVRDIHRSHVEAGARVVTALTFRTHRRALERVGLKGCSLRLTDTAVRLAREAVTAAQCGRPVVIAGSMSPLEDCFRADLVPDMEEARAEHGERANELAFTGVDLVMLETFNCCAEAEVALRAVLDTALPAVVSFTLGRDGALPSGESLRAAVRAVLPLKPLAIGVNCCLPSTVGTALAVLLEETYGGHVRVGAYPNVGSALGTLGWSHSYQAASGALADAAMTWVAAGARFVGGCCGASAPHIAAMAKALGPRLV